MPFYLIIDIPLNKQQDAHVKLKVIGAGLMRTGTSSLKIALEGRQGTFHSEVAEHLHKQWPRVG